MRRSMFLAFVLNKSFFGGFMISQMREVPCIPDRYCGNAALFLPMTGMGGML